LTRITRAAITVALSAGLLGAGSGPAGQQPIRVGVELVHFAVVVTDRRGAPVTDLTADDFEIRERGEVQEVRFFASGDPEAAPPLRLGFLLDSSGSMESDIREVRTAAIKFLNRNDHAEDVTLVDFDTEVRVARYGPLDFPRLIERIRMRKPGGYTAFYDALAVYLRTSWQHEGQKVVVAFTDGSDTRSTMRAGEVLELLKGSDVTMYALGYFQGLSGSARNMAQMELQRFTAMTGGQAFFPGSLKELDSVYERIQTEIEARYLLGYVSTNERRDGSWRPVEIRLKRPDLRGARVRTRTGYFAPYSPADAPPR
jgi:Ca-activated chloride channel homolog